MGVEFVKRDLALIEVEYPLMIKQALLKIKKDRGLASKIQRLATKSGHMMTLESFLDALDTLDEIYLFKYKIIESDDEEGYLRAEIELEDFFFQTMKLMQSVPFGRMVTSKLGQSPEGFFKKWEKNCKNYEPREFQVAVIQPLASVSK